MPRTASLLTVLTCLTAPTLQAQSAGSPPHVLVHALDEGADGPLGEDRGRSALHRRLLGLGTTASVLYTTGHPDDEEAGVLTWLARGRGVRTALLTLNRGEGGDNAVGSELFDALGLIRTEELRVAGRYYGLDDQYFTTAADYGYSKTLDEAFRSWDREAVLADMVRIIRMNRPLVVISRWHGSERDGHGHHQAAGVLTPLAVEAAGDPGRFPDQITGEGLRPWRVRKLYRGRVRDGEASHLEIDHGQYDPWLGRSYAAFGSYGLSLQRSQTSGRQRGGAGVTPVRYERLVGSGPDIERDPFEGMDVSLGAVFSLFGGSPSQAVISAVREAEERADRAVASFEEFDDRSVAAHLAAGLAAVRRAVEALPEESEAAWHLRIQEQRFRDALWAALGLRVEAVAVPTGAPAGAATGAVVPGQALDVHLDFANGAVSPVRVRASVQFRGRPVTPASPVVELETSGAGRQMLSLVIPSDATVDRPWFQRAGIAASMYDVRDSAAIHLSSSPPSVTVSLDVEVGGVDFPVAVPVWTLESDLPWGMIRRGLAVTPALSIRTTSAVRLVPAGRSEPIDVEVEITSATAEETEAVVSLDLPAGWSMEPASRTVVLGGVGDVATAGFLVRPMRGLAGAPLAVAAVVRSGGRSYRDEVRTIRHRGIETTRLHVAARTLFSPVRLAPVARRSVGYVTGVGDEVPAAITELGHDVRLLSEIDLQTGDLSAFETIVVGTRAYAVRPDLVANNERVLDYARSGGNLVVLYQTPEYDPATQAPIPAELPRTAEEVSEEDAPVTLLRPDHPMLSVPNRIETSDFDGWIEQRGSKFFASWDDAYAPLIETHDTDQAPQSGVWLTAQAGAGTFTYVALALHRQLPYGVPGAYRILANLLSAGSDGAR